jgi:CelD/BcsL family acetyltransferase involved in cellulose biosynthesis
MGPVRVLEEAPELSVEEVGSPETLAAEWTKLAERGGNVFGSWEWLSLWWEHYGSGRTLRIAACRRDDGELVAVLPLYMYSRGRLRIARFLGHGPGDELGPICAPSDRPLAARALRRVAEQWGLHLLVADRLPGDAAWRELGGSNLHVEASPLIRLETRSWDEFMAAKSRNFRQQTGKLERRLAREHRVEFRVTDDGDRLQRDLDLLFGLHGRRWSGQVSEFHGVDQPFQRAFAERAFELGWLRLRFLEVDGRAVATSYVLRFGNVDAEYQNGRDPDFERASVGFVLLNQAVRSAVEDGLAEYRFLRGGEEYKYRLATHDQQLETIALAKGLGGSAALAIGWRLRQRPALWSKVLGAKRLLGRH